VFDLAGTADEISPLLIKGELDAACVPANLASVLYNKTKGEIVTLGINTLGVLYVVDKGERVQSFADLKGKTVVSAGKGSVPEYAFRYLLTANGIDPDKDLTIEWKSEQAECVAALASGAAEIAVMPQPYVTVAQGKVEGLRVALSLTEEWEKLDNGSAMLTGVVVARKSFIEEHSDAVEAFLKDYAESVEWVNGNTAEAAKSVGDYGIVAAAVAEKALPYCNIVCITGNEMKTMLSGYLAALAEQAPQAVGGTLPADDFYFVG
jgi:NitT/TauT family transport system substrate-binding protein